ncbi:protein of unknown function [Cardinium endosymbiont cEper1 of Encarsia pergandiella]|nr:protein of unknown function [Cardinium endosymbiont cEper1 of Encarsia pergandiella]
MVASNEQGLAAFTILFFSFGKSPYKLFFKPQCQVRNPHSLQSFALRIDRPILPILF